MSRIVTYLAILWGGLCLTSTALGDVQRYALLVGNGIGHGPDMPLAYAEADASRLSQVLRDLGDFEPANVVLLQGENSDTVRRTLITLNDRIRSAQALPNTEALLFVYYSGHADARSLHLGATRLEFRELSQLVRGSAAKFRILLVDACRSGTLTQLKGGRIAQPFDIVDSSLSSEGMAFITASSADEDAQESDEIRGSFFTHAWVSGLLGAADRNGDGNVELAEAYSYAYDATIRATSRTFAGTQHPSFHYEVQGHGALVLTRPGRQKSQLVFPKGASYLVMKGSEHGPVVGEIGSVAPSRALSLPVGRYFVRGRELDSLLEGTVELQNERFTVDPSRLERVQYARLVRKGTHERHKSQAVELGLLGRPVLSDAPGTCFGAAVGYRLELQSMSVRGRFDYCGSSWKNDALSGVRREFSLSLDVAHFWDLRHASPFVGAGIGWSVVQQRFQTEAVAPSRLASSPLGFLLLGATVPLRGRFYVGGEARLEGALVRSKEDAFAEERLRLLAALRGTGFAGVAF